MPIIGIREDLCENCNICVDICPLDVLKELDGAIPVIAYREDCQSCYLCKISCPKSAIIITHERSKPTPLPF